MQSVVGVAMVPEAILEKLEPMHCVIYILPLYYKQMFVYLVFALLIKC